MKYDVILLERIRNSKHYEHIDFEARLIAQLIMTNRAKSPSRLHNYCLDLKTIFKPVYSFSLYQNKSEILKQMPALALSKST